MEIGVPHRVYLNSPSFLIHPPDAKTATIVGWYHLIHLFQKPSSVNCSEVGNIHGIPIDGSEDDKLPSVMTTADYKAFTHDFMDDIAPP